MCSVEDDLYESEQVRKVPTGINGFDSGSMELIDVMKYPERVMENSIFITPALLPGGDRGHIIYGDLRDRVFLENLFSSEGRVNDPGA